MFLEECAGVGEEAFGGRNSFLVEGREAAGRDVFRATGLIWCVAGFSPRVGGIALIVPGNTFETLSRLGGGKFPRLCC